MFIYELLTEIIRLEKDFGEEFNILTDQLSLRNMAFFGPGY